MAHYAYLDPSSVVTGVIVGKDENDSDIDWENYYGAVRTSYNTRGGQHTQGGTPFRYNYASIGYTFSNDPQWASQGGAFIPPQPFPSWILNPDTALWDPPVPMPTEGGPWVWDEDSLSWVEVVA